MTRTNAPNFFSRTPVIFASILVSGFGWYLSTGLNGDHWWLVWFAPVPILMIIPEVIKQKAFWIAFIAYLIGRLSWVPYLNSVLPRLMVIIFTLSLPLLFAIILLVTRNIILKSKHWAAFLSFPVLYAGFEWIYFQVSRDGTAGSLAYSQADCMPLIQIASITGVTGISFIICLIPALLAGALHFRRDMKPISPPLILLSFTIALIFTFGFIRLNRFNDSPTVKIGMIVIDELYRDDSTETILQQYAKVMDSMKGDSLQIILLPEKIVSIANDAQLKIITDAANRNNVDLIVGITRESKKEKLNQSLLFSGDQPAQAYTKVNLYEGEAYEGYTPGRVLHEGSWRNESIGLVVCKDMDFDRFIRQYKKATILFVPAWDFIRDDWLHSRMAIMRGVENGFSIARNARQGRLTISDFCGRVLTERSSADGKEQVLIGQLPAIKIPCLFSKIGNIPGLLYIIAASWILILFFKNKAA